ncbi:tRNA1(Val) (adenine(37)-N6)-methyltransferase [Aquifex pyrophilus]
MKSTDKPVPFFGGKLRFYQPENHKISVDLLVFLSKVRGIKRSSRVIDLGAGFGFLSITLAKKFGVKVVALEIEDLMLELLKKNVEINNVENLVEVVKGDVREVEKVFKRASFDVVITNPPFYPPHFSPKPDPYHFELRGSLKDFIRASSYLLRDGGYLNILLPCFRTSEAFSLMETYNLPPRYLALIYPTLFKKARLSIIVGIRNVKGPLECEEPLIINEEKGYTPFVRELLDNFL